MASATRKTRGPRTRHERESDSAQRIATLIEDDPYAGELLRAVGVLLRTMYGSSSPIRTEAAKLASADAYKQLAEWVDYFRLFTVPPGATKADADTVIVRRLEGLLERVEGVLEGTAPRRPTLTLVT